MTEPISSRPTGASQQKLSAGQVHVPTSKQEAEKPLAPKRDEYLPAKAPPAAGAATCCCGQSPCCCSGGAAEAQPNAPTTPAPTTPTPEPAAEPSMETLREHSFLKVGASGPEVLDLQTRLGLQATGTFDDATKAAVTKYQQDQKLKVDGLVGQQTWGRLLGIKAELKPGTNLLGALKPPPANTPASWAPTDPTADPVPLPPRKPAPPGTQASPPPPSAPAPAAPQSNGAVSSLFTRLDGNGNGSISGGEVRAMVQRAGVGGGFFGGMKIDGATTQLMGQFDGNRNGIVNPRELRSGLQKLMRTTLGTNASQGQFTRKTMDWFKRIDANHNGTVTESELASRINAELERKGESMASTKAEIVARVGAHILGRPGARSATRAEVERLAEDLDVG